MQIALEDWASTNVLHCLYANRNVWLPSWFTLNIGFRHVLPQKAAVP